MSSYHWDNAPIQVKQLVDRFVRQVEVVLGNNLVGIYLHGSLASGCFNPAKSDIDLLLVTQRKLPHEERRQVTELFLSKQLSHFTKEIDLLVRSDLANWIYPIPYDYKYCDDAREYEQWWLSNDESDDSNKTKVHFDLAAHITVLNHCGIVLKGPPVREIFPIVPFDDYLDSLCRDLDWNKEYTDLLYSVLNLFRILAAFQEHLVLSKLEGAEWGLAHLPESFHPIIREAKSAYQSEGEYSILREQYVWIVDEILNRIQAIRNAGR